MTANETTRPAIRPWHVVAAAFLGAALGAAATGALVGPGAPALVPPSGACREADGRLAEVATLLEDAAAPTLVAADAGRLLAAAAGTLSAIEARLHRHGACRAGEIAALRARIAARRAAAREVALTPVLAALERDGTVADGREGHAAMAALAAARLALARAQADAGGEPDETMQGLQRRLEAAYGEWAREQQRRYDLWALGEARELDRWARRRLSDIPLRGASREEIAAELVRRMGPVDVRLTGPAVQAVHAELFQRLWRELGEEARIAVVADLVAAAKRRPEEF
ncbi:hypothetical protein [Stella sp.]|uniref:hypothetical protein n=1 Tax=Stella sp. TaxID=2912054 RepID=UPI0035ADA2C5